MAAPCISLASLFLLLSIPIFVEGKADDSMCPRELTNLLPCLNYVQGKAPVPSKECCTNLLSVHLHEPVCLCELIAASTGSNSQLGGGATLPPMNTTLALQLGPVCEVKTNPHNCPGLLGIPASSPQAKIFESSNSSAASSAAPSATSSSSNSSSSSANSSTGTPSNGSISVFASSLASLIASYVLILICYIL